MDDQITELLASLNSRTINLKQTLLATKPIENDAPILSSSLDLTVEQPSDAIRKREQVEKAVLAHEIETYKCVIKKLIQKFKLLTKQKSKQDI